MTPKASRAFIAIAILAAMAWKVQVAAGQQQVSRNGSPTGNEIKKAGPLVAVLAGLAFDGQSTFADPLAKLAASDGVAFDYLGYSVAVSGDTVAVGAALARTDSNPLEGAVYVFVKPATGWANMTQVAKLTSSDRALGDHFGFSVAINGDTIVVGAPGVQVGSNINQGAVYVYSKPASGWRDMTETAKLTAADGAASDTFGWSVSISADGATVVAGEPGPTARVFVKPASGWVSMTQTADLTASDSAGVNDDFGVSVAISGSTVVVGALGATTFSSGAPEFQGAAYVFVQPITGWSDMTQTAKLTASNGSYAGFLGASVGISGNTVVAGAPGTNDGKGAAYVFVEPASGWSDVTETAELTSDIFGNELGWSVAIAGQTVVAGAPQWPAYDGPGHAYVFLKPNTGWHSTSKFRKKLAAVDGAVNDFLGYSVAVGGDTVIAGAYGVTVGSNPQQGSAYVFERPQ